MRSCYWRSDVGVALYSSPVPRHAASPVTVADILRMTSQTKHSHRAHTILSLQTPGLALRLCACQQHWHLSAESSSARCGRNCSPAGLTRYTYTHVEPIYEYSPVVPHEHPSRPALSPDCRRRGPETRQIGLSAPAENTACIAADSQPQYAAPPAAPAAS